MTKPTFIPVNAERKQLDPVAYTPLIYIAGTATHRLALHKSIINPFMPDTKREWVVSDPKSGAKILTVRGTYKGVPCSSVGMRVTEARAAAMASLEELLERIGSERFNAVLAGGAK